MEDPRRGSSDLVEEDTSGGEMVVSGDAAPRPDALIARHADPPVPGSGGAVDQLEGIVERLSEGAYLVDTDRRVRAWNKGAEETTGYSSADVVGRRCCDNVLSHVDAAGAPLCTQRCPLIRTLRDGLSRETKAYLHHRNGQRLPTRLRTVAIRDNAGQITGALEVFSELAAGSATQQQLDQAALIDALTGLANRQFTEISLRRGLAEMSRFGWTVGVLMLGIDDVTHPSGACGHGVGDGVRQLVAQTLSNNLRPFDTVGRWGEDFLVIVKNTDRSKLERLADKLARLVESAGLPVDDCATPVTVSVGVAVASSSDDPKALVTRAESQMRRARRQGRARGANPAARAEDQEPASANPHLDPPPEP